MSTRFEFQLSNEDTERLFYLKRKGKFRNMTGNDYAKAVLENTLRHLCLTIPEYDETGM